MSVAAGLAESHLVNRAMWRSLRDVTLAYARVWQSAGNRRSMLRTVAEARRLNRLAIQEGRAARGLS